MKTTILHVRLTADEMAKIKALAADEAVSVWVRQLIRAELARQGEKK